MFRDLIPRIIITSASALSASVQHVLIVSEYSQKIRQKTPLNKQNESEEEHCLSHVVNRASTLGGSTELKRGRCFD